MSQGPQLTASSPSSTDEIHGSLIRRSWHAMSELLSPFSQGALAQLPKKPARPSRYTRANEIPDVEPTEEDGQMPTVRDYHSITVPPQVRVPKKMPTPVRVEGKVWFANERSPYLFSLSSFKALDPFLFLCSSLLWRPPFYIFSYLDADTDVLLAWVSYINMSILIGTLAVAMFNASKDRVARNFAYVYAVISVGILVCAERSLSFFFPLALLPNLIHPFKHDRISLGVFLCVVPASYYHDS
jgi:hypothetical protein